MEEASITIKKIKTITLPSTLLERRINTLLPKPYSTLTKQQKLKVLDTLLPKCQWCHLSQRNKPVPPTKGQNPKVTVIGRNPGKGDTEYGSLFSNPYSASHLWDKYLETLNLQHRDVQILNVANCYVNRNVAPQPHELSICKEWLYLYLDALPATKYIFVLGNDAIRSLLGPTHPSIGRIYGDLYETTLNGNPCLICPIQHPGFILRHPEEWSNTKTLLSVIRTIMEGNNI